MATKYQKEKFSKISRFVHSEETLGIQISDESVAYFNLPSIDVFKERGEGSGRIFASSSIGSNMGEECFAHAANIIGRTPEKVYMILINEDDLGVPFVDLILSAHENEAPDVIGTGGGIDDNLNNKEKEDIGKVVRLIFDHLSLKDPVSARGFNQNVRSSSRYIREGDFSGFITRQKAVINVNLSGNELYFNNSKIIDFFSRPDNYKRVGDDNYQLMINAEGMSSVLRVSKDEMHRILSDATKFKIKCVATQRSLDPIRLEDMTKVSSTIQFLEKKLDDDNKAIVDDSSLKSIDKKWPDQNKNDSIKIEKLGGAYKSVNDNLVPAIELAAPGVGIAFKAVNAIFFAIKTAYGIKRHVDKTNRPSA